MKLQEVFDQLSVGELCQISIGGQEPGVLNGENYAKIIPHVNLGLAAIYKRFYLKEGRLKIGLQDGQVVYPISLSVAVSNTRSTAPVKWLLDSISAPFKEDILKIERVLGSLGNEFPLNDIGNEYSLTTPNSQTLRVPEGLVTAGMEFPDDWKTSTLEVIYRANHNKIVVPLGYFDPARVEIELPYTHLEPLLWFIASRVNNPIGMGQEFNAGNQYYQKYELACQQLEVSNFQIDLGSSNTRLRDNGWV